MASDTQLTEGELKELMRGLRPACDALRVVEPGTFRAHHLDDTGDGFKEPYRCYSALGKDRRCKDCISLRACEEKQSVSKFEFVGNDAYFITARYLEVDGHPRSLEMVQRVTGNVGIDGTGVQELAEQVQEETDHAFLDEFTGAFNRHYFDSGLHATMGHKFALVKILNLGRINDAEGNAVGDLVLKRMAHEIQRCIRIVDTLIRYHGDMFAIQFEETSSRTFPQLIADIAEATNGIALETHPAARPVVAVAGVDEEATFDQLASRARELLAQMEQTGIFHAVYAGENRHEVDEVRSASAAESLYQESADTSVDGLTGLASTGVFRHHLQEKLHEPVDAGNLFCVLYIDLENFKSFNRAFGYAGGDILLKSLADSIRDEFPDDPSCRLAGDTFAILTRNDGALGHFKRLYALIDGYQKRVPLELKAGLCVLDGAEKDASTVLEHARLACESIKGRFEEGWCYYDTDLDQHLTMSQYVVNNLERALDQGWITVFYQPIIRAMTGQVCDYEALCRWNDPAHGLLAPAVFIETLEHYHLISQVDVYMVNRVCEHQAHLLEQGKPIVPISVNLSRLDFQLADIFDAIETAVTRTGIPRSALNIEVTESALNEDAAYFSKQIERFRKAGYEVWMDDFGSGYSSLNLLKDYGFDTLKIDMGFLRGFDDNPKSREIIVSVVDMAKRLGIRTVVEGVETEQQYRFLQRIGCEMLQGFLFDRPRPYEELQVTPAGIEKAGERAYFDAVGSVNLLGMGDAGDFVGGSYSTESESRSIPLAVVERRGMEHRYLSANEPYLKLMGGIEPLADVDYSSSDALTMSDELARSVDACLDGGKPLSLHRKIGGVEHIVHFRHIASSPDAQATLVMPIEAE